MTELVLVRHGQASFGAEDYDKLSPLGHEQARWLGQYFRSHDLSFDHVVRGNLRRHRETAEGIAEAMTFSDIAIDQRFDEFHYDPLQVEYLAATGTDAPQNRDNFLEMFPALFTAWEEATISGGGETYQAFSDRVAEAIDSIVALGGVSLIVTSGGVIGTTIGRVLGLDARRTAEMTLNIHNASVHRLVLEQDRLRLSLYNASPHLDPAERSHARTYV